MEIFIEEMEVLQTVRVVKAMEAFEQFAFEKLEVLQKFLLFQDRLELSVQRSFFLTDMFSNCLNLSANNLIRILTSGSLGVRVIGGNQVGIFVSAVQEDSPAAIHSIRSGDRIISVNEKSMIGVTREEVYICMMGF